MDWVILISSSALVAGTVSALLSNIFEDRKYIRDKKLSIYSDFLDQVDRFIPAEDLGGSTPDETVVQHVKVEFYRLEKHILRVELIATDEDIRVRAKNIYMQLRKCAEIIDQIHTEGKGAVETKGKLLTAQYRKAKKELKELVSLMNQDIRKVF